MVNFYSVETFKRVHPGTKIKRYAVGVGGHLLRISWTTRTKAKIYGDAVRSRYLKLLAAQSKLAQKK